MLSVYRGGQRDPKSTQNEITDTTEHCMILFWHHTEHRLRQKPNRKILRELQYFLSAGLSDIVHRVFGNVQLCLWRVERGFADTALHQIPDVLFLCLVKCRNCCVTVFGRAMDVDPLPVVQGYVVCIPRTHQFHEDREAFVENKKEHDKDDSPIVGIVTRSIGMVFQVTKGCVAVGESRYAHGAVQRGTC